MDWRKIVAGLFIVLAIVILLLGVHSNLWTFHDVAPYIVSGLVGGIPTAVFFILRTSTIIRKTNNIEATQEQKNVTPNLEYDRIILRTGNSKSHGGEYLYSSYFLEIINTIPNTLAHECETFIELQNTDIKHINAYWDKDNSEITSIGQKELVKLFTISKFKDENNNITTNLIFYKKTSDGYISDIPNEWDDNMNKKLVVQIQSSDAKYPFGDEIFKKTLLEITYETIDE